MKGNDMPATYEVRDDPDDLPRVFDTCSQAERYARKRSRRIGSPCLIYEVTEDRETYLGTA
jgi:hypothetical protein